MRIVRRVALVLGILLLVFVLFVGFLLLTNPDPREADGWTRHADLPSPRGEVASAVAGDRLYVIGGLQGGFGRTTDRVDVYDAGEDAWTEGPALPEKRHHAAAAAIGDTIYVSGGSLTATNWEPLPEVWALRADASRWEEVEPMPEGRMGHQMVAFGDRLHVIGGRGGADVLIYDPVSGWSRGAPLPQPRDHLVAAVVGESNLPNMGPGSPLFAIGGRDDAIRSRVDVYVLGDDVWTDGPELPEGMSAMAVGLLEDGIHVVGGEDVRTFGGGVIDAHYVLRDGHWEEDPLPILATHGSAYGVIEGRLYVVGGARRQGAFSTVAWTGLTQSFGI